MSAARGEVPDAIGAVIAYRILATLQAVPAAVAAEIGRSIVRELEGDGWKICPRSGPSAPGARRRAATHERTTAPCPTDPATTPARSATSS